MKKFTLFFLMLAAIGSSNAVAQIDSLTTDFRPQVGFQVLETSVAFDLYVSDSMDIQSITIKLGTTLGAEDVAVQTLSPANLSYLMNQTSGVSYFYIPIGSYLILPPYVKVVIVTSSGLSYAIDKQIVN